MRTRLILVAIALLSLQACDKDEPCINGSGQVADYTLSLDDFNRVVMDGPINLRLIQGQTQTVVIKAEPEIYSLLEHQVTNSIFEVGYKNKSQCFNSSVGVWVVVTIPDLKALEIEGVSEVISNGPFTFSDLEITTSGTSEIILTGSATDLVLGSSGVTTFDGFGLTSTNVELNVEGSGDFEVNCTNALDITVSGAATVTYKGTPVINQDVSGTLNLINGN